MRADHTAHHALSIVTVVTAAAVLFCLLVRIRFGISLQDESLYLALPYRFLLGNRPFVDELCVQQIAGLLVYPLVRGYVAVTGGTAGIMLFARTAYVLFTVAVAATVVRALSVVVRWQYATLISLVCLWFVPWCLPNLSYNTLGSGFFTTGTLLGAAGLWRRPRTGLLLAAGLAHALSAFAYPPLAPAVLFSFVLLVRAIPDRHRRKHSWIAYALGALVVGIPTAVFVLPELLRILRLPVLLPTQGGGGSKLLLVAQTSLSDLAREPGLLLAAGLLLLGARSRRAAFRRASGIAAMFLPLSVLPLHGFDGWSRSLGVVTYSAVLGILVVYGHRWARGTGQLLRLLLLPSLLAGLLFAYASNNGVVNAGFGLLPAAFAGSLGSVIIVLRSMKTTRPSSRAGVMATALAPAVGPLLQLLLLGVQLGGIYDDASIRQLSTQVTEGPFRGLRTTHDRAEFVTRLQHDLERVVRPDDRVLFYDQFPAGYLMTSGVPATITVGAPDPVVFPSFMPLLVSYYERERLRPTVATRVLDPTHVHKSHPIAEFLGKDCVEVARSPSYTICRAGP